LIGSFFTVLSILSFLIGYSTNVPKTRIIDDKEKILLNFIAAADYNPRKVIVQIRRTILSCRIR
jgi:hypothetical protein